MRFFTFLLFASLIFGCTHLEIEETIPSLDGITAANIDSKLGRFNIESDPDSFEYMYRNFKEKIEISAQIEYYDAQNNLVFTESGIINIRGSGSANNEMKSIGIVFDKKIDNLKYQIIKTNQALPGHDLSKIQNVRLRNSGNDDGITQLKDLSLTNFVIANGLELELKYGTPVQVFSNGLYFGLLNVRTENDRLALSDLLNVDSSSITMMKIDFYNGNMKYKEGDEELAQRLRQAIKDENANELNELLSIDNFIDYIVYQDYIGNIDWPHNNARMYSVNGNKFRFLLYDLDLAVTQNKMQRLPQMEYLDDDISKMYQILRDKDETFIPALENRQKILYTQFSPASFNMITDELSNNIDGEIEYLIAKYGPPNSTLEWQMNVEQLKRDFDRCDYYNRKKYGLK
jgi:hypothetical protein